MAYHLGRELGSGAIGRVVEINDDDGGAWAGKILHASQRDERARGRFQAEGRLLAGVSHPNLIRVDGIVEIEGHAVLLMELVTGADLARLIAAEAPLPPERVIALGRGIAAGLGEAHRAGLVHRDLKPANVLLTGDGTPKVADFGLARAASFAAADPNAAAVAGTPDYMAPESIDPLAIDGRSDLYALGCILCELATGAPPYRGATALAILAAHRADPLPALEDVPLALRRVIRWLLAKSPADRPQSAEEVEAALVSADAPTALALPGKMDGGARRKCATCGAMGPKAVQVCFTCGRPQLELASGLNTVFITGPGEHAHKLDAALRQRLLSWIAERPELRLDAAVLAKQVPRIPFVLVSRVDDASAKALELAVAELGLQVESRRGGRLSHPGVRSKGWVLTRRIAVIGVSGTFYFMHHAFLGAVGTMAAVSLGAAWTGFWQAARPVTRPRAEAPRAVLPSVLDAALGRVSRLVPAMEAARHRDALRGVVERALLLRDAVAPTERASLDGELARLLDVAALAASRLDQLEQELSPDDLRSDDDGQRARWHARDRCAAKVLQVTAFLDAMRARAVMSTAKRLGATDLDDIRVQIEALEELERLT